MINRWNNFSIDELLVLEEGLNALSKNNKLNSYGLILHAQITLCKTRREYRNKLIKELLEKYKEKNV